MNILVTVVRGVAGFIGSHVVDQFVRDGHHVSVVDDLSTGKRKQVHRQAVFYKLNACSTRILFASSGGAVYGKQEAFSASESHPTRPLSPYGISKLTCEYSLEYYRHVAGLKYVALRSANIYGPRQHAAGEAGVIAIFTQKMLTGEHPRMNGNGFQTRDDVYVGDVVEAVRAVSLPSVEGIFNVGTGIETTVNERFTRLKELTNSQCQKIHGPTKKGEQIRRVLDASKLEKETAWTRTVSLPEGLDETVKFFQQQHRRFKPAIH